MFNTLRDRGVLQACARRGTGERGAEIEEGIGCSLLVHVVLESLGSKRIFHMGNPGFARSNVGFSGG